MATGALMCAHCSELIADTTTQVIHGDMAYCCPNCAAAMEQEGSGSDPQALSHEGDLICFHCGVPIIDEQTMESRDDQAFCCGNCANDTEGHSGTPVRRAS
jgi:hypothetical protein